MDFDDDFTEAALRTAAGRLRAIRIDELIDLPDNRSEQQLHALAEAVHDGTATNPRAADAVLRAAAERLAGCLILAGDEVAEILGTDLNFVREGARVGDDPEYRIDVLWQLPQRFAHRYDAAFTQQFLDSYRDLVARLQRSPWQPPSCVAHELGLRLLLNRVDLLVHTHELTVSKDWRCRVEELLFEDLDHELLYDPACDGIEDDPNLGSDLRLEPMNFEAWFEPFHKGPLPDSAPRPAAPTS
ncbi:MAG: hypothetical protein ACT4QF_14060 [Sporichthyaceae bacterium]